MGSKCRGGWTLCNVINLRGQTETFSLPSVRLEAEPMQGGSVLTGHSGDKECIWTWLGWIHWGPAGDGGYFWSPMPLLSKADRRRVPDEHWFSPRPQRQPLGNLEVCELDDKKMEQINDSNLFLAFSHHVSFIHTSYSDEQCITQKYKGKILVLHYTFSKIYTE